MTNDKSATTASSASGDLTVTELADYLAKVFGEGIPPADLNASVSGNSLMVKSLSGTTPVSFDDATQAFLQFREEHVSMRQRPMTTTEALGIKGSFRILEENEEKAEAVIQYIGWLATTFSQASSSASSGDVS